MAWLSSHGGGRVKVSCCFWGVCEQGGEGEGVMLAVSSSLQTGDPGLQTGHLRLLQEEKSTGLDDAAGSNLKPSKSFTTENKWLLILRQHTPFLH